jgi:dihydropteroate synthase-like protein
MSHSPQHIHFVTGRLAEHSVRETVERVAQQVGFQYSLQVLPITVAALITSKWLMRHIKVPPEASSVILPGYVQQEIDWVRSQLGIEVIPGPKDIRDLPAFFGQKPDLSQYGAHSIEILAEINHANRLPLEMLLQQAAELASAGADMIDLGCTPGEPWTDVGLAVSELTAAGYRISIDSFEPTEVEAACRNGASLVLSVNSANRHVAAEWNTEVVVIPDTPNDQKSFEQSIEFLARASVPMRLDPILEPIGCGFSESLARYFGCRQQYPDAKMLMGIGNITELTDADSAPLNVLLLGICQELGVQSVLTTQVINWARSSVAECDLARRLVRFACQRRIPPKHIEPRLVLLRDERIYPFDTATMEELASTIRDKNIRIFNGAGEIHAVAQGVYAHSEDPFEVMQQVFDSHLGDSISPGHAFYLGFEMAKALTANTLGKQYTQDESLNWGFLTRTENHHRLSRKS